MPISMKKKMMSKVTGRGSLMWQLEFLPEESREWTSSLSLAGCSMCTEPFESARHARTAKSVLIDLWPTLQVRVVRIDED